MRSHRVLNGALAALMVSAAFVAIKKVLLNPERTPIQIVLYGAAPLVLAALCALSLKRSPRFRMRVLVGLCILGTGLYVVQLGILGSKIFEAKARRSFPGWDQYKAAWRAGHKFDTRTPLQVLDELKKNAEDAVPVMAPSLFWNGTEKLVIDGKTIAPVASISSAKTVYCNETGEYLVYVSDEHGFHNPKGLYTPEPDIMVVGDSMTQGACVKSEENAVARIREAVPRTINLGYADNGPLSELATLTEMAPPLRPKLVLWFYYEGNDLEGLVDESNSPLLSPYLRKGFSNGLFSRQGELDPALRKIADRRESAARGKKEPLLGGEDLALIKASAGSFFTLRLLRSAMGLMDVGFNRAPAAVAQHPELPTLHRILSQAKELVESWNGKLVFVYLPEWQNFATPGFTRTDREPVLGVVRDAGVPVIDVLPAFKAHPDPLSLFPHRTYGHYNPEGYQLAAKTILDGLPRH